MALYTFIMEFLGGTYIGQIRSPSVYSACVKWAETIDVAGVKGLGPRGQRRLVTEMQDDVNRPVPLDDVTNAWCTGALIHGHSALINIVRTDEQIEASRNKRSSQLRASASATRRRKQRTRPNPRVHPAGAKSQNPTGG